METNQIINTNDKMLLADFLGFEPTELGWYDANEVLKLPNSDGNTFDNLLFAESWDWLMPVVEKIETTVYQFRIDLNELTEKRELTQSTVAPFDFYDHDTKEWVYKLELERTGISFGGERFKTKIEAYYVATVEFIKWYNAKNI